MSASSSSSRPTDGSPPQLPTSGEVPKTKGGLLRTLSSHLSRSGLVPKASQAATSSTIERGRASLKSSSNPGIEKVDTAARPFLGASSEEAPGMAIALAAHATSVAFASSSSASSSGAASSSSSPPAPSIDSLLRRGQDLLGVGEMRAASSSSRSPTLPEESRSYADRADQMIKELEDAIPSGVLINGSSDVEQIQEMIKLRTELMQWANKERASKTEMVVTLVRALSKTMPQREFSALGFGDLVGLADQLSKSPKRDVKYQLQLQLLQSFDALFHNELNFRQLAKHCAEWAVHAGDSGFEYRRLPGGSGYTLALGVTKQTQEGPKFFRLFVCKPVVAQPGGAQYFPEVVDPKSEKDRMYELVMPFGGARGIEVNHVVCSSQVLHKNYPMIFEKPLLSVIEPSFPMRLRSEGGQEEVQNTETMVMEFCPNAGTLEAEFMDLGFEFNNGKLFYHDQLEQRFMVGLIFGFADQNIGNELIIDDRRTQVEGEAQGQVRLKSIDMGQAMPGTQGSANSPFYITDEYLRTPQFYRNVAEKIRDVDFNALVNDLVHLYKKQDMPLTKEQIKFLIVRCENLKIFADLYREKLEKGEEIPAHQVRKAVDQIVTGYGLGEVQKKGFFGALDKGKRRSSFYEATYAIKGKKYRYRRPLNHYGFFVE